MKNASAVAAVVLLATSQQLFTQAGTQPAYFGKWKFNPAKSDIGGYEIAFADLGGGELQQTTDDGRSYKFRLDGKPYDDGAGRTASWKQLGPTSWEAATYTKGTLSFTGRLELSAPGNEMTIINKYAAPAMGEIKMTWRRIGAGSGLVGKWSSRVEIPAFEMLIEPDGANGIRMSSPGFYEVRAQFDGKPYPTSGPSVSPGSTASFERNGPHSLRTREVTAGAVFDGVYSVSDDRQTLTETGYEGKIKRTWVFDRVRNR